MRGFGFREHGGLDRLAYVEVPTPVPGPGEVRVRLQAAAFNRLDRFVLEGMPGVPIARPHILGSDGAGVVDALGEGVDDLRPGEAVLLNPGLWDGTCEACRAGREALCRHYQIIGEHTQGTVGEFVVVPRRNIHRRPERLSVSEAAAAPLVFQTVWRALRTIGALAAGERVAVIGAGGGTATAAVQVARYLGGRVAVVSRSPEKAERALALGAEAALVPTDTRPLDRLLWEWSDRKGVDLIFDSAGTATLPLSVRSLARGGRVVVIGATSGPLVEIDLRTLFWRQASIRGSTMASPAEFDEVLAVLARGELRPVLDSEWTYARAVEAFERLGSPELFGKVVVTLHDLAGSGER